MSPHVRLQPAVTWVCTASMGRCMADGLGGSNRRPPPRTDRRPPPRKRSQGRLVMVSIDRCNAYSLYGRMREVLPVGSGAEGLGRRREVEYAEAAAGVAV
eukprot:365876-Chlamydomonas_euryale.AAC.2